MTATPPTPSLLPIDKDISPSLSAWAAVDSAITGGPSAPGDQSLLLSLCLTYAEKLKIIQHVENGEKSHVAEAFGIPRSKFNVTENEKQHQDKG